MPYSLDTNTCIQVFRNHPNVISRLAALPPGDCRISTISSYELFTGVAKCADANKEHSKVDLLLETATEIVFDRNAAVEAGRLRGYLESRGEMIGPYDILLAAQALIEKLVLVTANTDEFQRVPGLTVENLELATS